MIIKMRKIFEKNPSRAKSNAVKKRIAAWMTALMALLSVLLLVYILIISDAVAMGTTREQLTRTVRANAQLVSLQNGRLAVADGFHYAGGGITTLIYSQSETLLAGQVPVGLTGGEPFQDGVIRTVDAGETSYFVLDLWVPSGWENGVWLRGMTEAPDVCMMTVNMVLITLVTLPLFLLLAALGSYRIAKRAFRPLDRINATAETICEARDLRGRIGLPAGTDEFSRLAANFDEMFERLERSFEAEKKFTSDASHELRTPVSIIKGACEYAEKYGEEDSPEERRENIGMIHRQANRMTHLITQLLHMTRMEQGTEGAKPVPLDLGAETEALVAEQFPNEVREGSCLTVSVQQGITVAADRELLARLLRNLIENGFKYGREDIATTVTVTVTRTETEALLCVRDNGIGIPEEEHEKIWKRFYRADTSRTDGESTGLGLSMVAQIAHLFGGYMTLDSKVGQGSTFTLHLPIPSPPN